MKPRTALIVALVCLPVPLLGWCVLILLEWWSTRPPASGAARDRAPVPATRADVSDRGSVASPRPVD